MKATKKATKKTKPGMPGMISSDIVIPKVGDTVRLHPDVARRWELRSGMKKGAYDTVKEVDGTVVQVDRAYGMCSVQWETGNDNWLPPRLHVMDLVVTHDADRLEAQIPAAVLDAIIAFETAVDDEAVSVAADYGRINVVEAHEYTEKKRVALLKCLIKHGISKRSSAAA